MSLCIIFDTNALLHFKENNFLENLLKLASTKDFVLVVPYIVLQELDALKGSSKKIAGKAQRTITCIQSILKSNPVNHHFVIQERDQNLLIGLGDSNDDKILDCCLYWIERISSFSCLVTGDRNLAVKCMVHSVLTLDPGPFDDCNALFSHLSSLTPLDFKRAPSSPGTEMLVDEDSEIQDPHGEFMTLDMAILLEQIYAILVNAFTEAMHPRLLDKGYPQPPWSFEIILHILEREHLITFTEKQYPPYFTKDMLNPIRSLAKDVDRSVRQHLCTLTKGDIKSFIKSITEYLYICEYSTRDQVISHLKEIVQYNL